MTEDSEIEAMRAITLALKELDRPIAERVLRWAISRFLPSESKDLCSIAGSGALVPSTNSSLQASGTTMFSEFPSLFDAANPQTGPERALVAAYWFQVSEGAEGFDSFAINSALKNLGHVSANITRDLDRLIAKTPRLVIQTRKLGSSKQARKQYMLTREGVRVVESMLAGNRMDDRLS